MNNTMKARIGIFADDMTRAGFSSVAHQAKDLSTKLSGIGRGMQRVGASATVPSLAVGAFLTDSVKGAIDLDDAMADVRKVLDGASKSELTAMRDEFMTLGPVLGQTATGMAEIAAAAGQSGIDKSEIVEWSAMVAKVGTAYDMQAGEAGVALAKIRASMGLTTDTTKQYAGVINELSNSMAATAPEILDVVRRVGVEAVATMGMTKEEVAALGGALVATGAETEVAATSIRNMGKALTIGAAATSRHKAGFRAIGLDAVAVSKHMQKDAMGTIKTVIARVNELPKHMQKATLSQIFGDEARALAPLIDNIDLLGDALLTANDSRAAALSIETEWMNRMDTTGQIFKKLSGQIFKVQVILAEALLPTIEKVAEAVGNLADWFSNLDSGTQTTIATTLALAAAFAPVMWVLGGVVAGIGKLIFVARLLGGGLMAAKVAIAAFSRGALLAGAINIPTLAASFKTAAIAARGLAASAMTVAAPFAALAVVFAALAYSAIKHWEELKTRTVEIFTGMVEVLKGVGDLIKGVFTGDWQAVADAGIKIWEDFSTLVFNVWNGLFDAIATIVDDIAGLVIGWLPADWQAPVTEFVTGFTDLIRNIPENVVAIFATIGEKIAEWSGLATGDIQVLIDAVVGFPAQIASIPGKIGGIFKEMYDNVMQWLSPLTEKWENLTGMFDRFTGKVTAEVDETGKRVAPLEHAASVRNGKAAAPAVLSILESTEKVAEKEARGEGVGFVSPLNQPVAQQSILAMQDIAPGDYIGNGIGQGLTEKQEIELAPDSKVKAEVLVKVEGGTIQEVTATSSGSVDEPSVGTQEL